MDDFDCDRLIFDILLIQVRRKQGRSGRSIRPMANVSESNPSFLLLFDPGRDTTDSAFHKHWHVNNYEGHRGGYR